jgi:hypothetical protein
MCGPDRPGYRALAALAGDRVVGVAEYERTGRDEREVPPPGGRLRGVAEGWGRRLLHPGLVGVARVGGAGVQLEVDVVAYLEHCGGGG